MDSHRLLAFVGVAVLLLVTPGVDMALVTRTALRHGRRAAFHTALGIDTGVAVWALAAAVGLAGLLRASAVAFTALKLLGAAYLCVLGFQSLRASVRGGGAHSLTGGPATPSALPAGRAFRQGVLNNLLNPKIAVFFTGFLPQFVDPSRAVLPQTLLLGAIHLALSLAWLLGYAAVASRAADLLRRPRISAALERLTGAVLIGFGLRLAVERR
jgi:RhtB (resistance to homoserine/threonine) family protein